ncbi:modulator of apoptosis 1-like [Ptychodera flava]|uniref:modulator of apoptosis 1-like n=1 Tax=Ptychodera flava TaxID=63121 RepID=UPI003969C4C5
MQAQAPPSRAIHSTSQSGPPTTAVHSLEFPRIVVSSGKGDVTYEMWRYEVRGLLRDDVFPEAIIMQAVRKSLRAAAAEVLLHVGEDVTVSRCIDKMDMVFGKVLPPEAVLEKFYTARQSKSEKIAEWACRIEGLLDELRQRQTMARETLETMLRTKFFSGLQNDQIRNAIRHKYDAGETYSGLLLAARMLETNQEATTRIQQATVADKDVLAKLAEVTQGLAKLTKKVEDLERKSASQNQPHQRHSNQHTQQRSNFTGKCYKCGQVGHRKAECHLNGQRPVTMRDMH